MRIGLIVLAIVAAGALLLARVVLFSGHGGIPATSYDAQLAACRSYPNGSTQAVAETSRLTITLPKAMFPNQNGLLTFTTASGTATAGYISNAGEPGSSYGATTGCFATYYEFDGEGEVDLIATSSVQGVPEYRVRFEVSPANPTPLAGTGTVSGSVLLGPTCPVERVPPDPQCAPKPYQTSIRVQSVHPSVPYTTISSDASGAFSISLYPGIYTFTPRGGNSMPPTCRAQQVTVEAGQTKHITLDCDTGIR